MSLLSLINWRREIFSIYNEVRSEEDGIIAWNKWKDKREKLFKFHPESPTFNPKKQSEFNDAPVLYSYNEKFSLFSKFELISNPEIIQLNTDENSITRLKPFIKTTDLKNFLGIELTVFKIEGYGGGLFLPFTDSGCKSGGEHYEGGRYLIDTIKGADLGEVKTNELRLDFNFSYNPSCSYNSKWTCPILNDYNSIPIFVDAGEKKPKNFLM
ncbi:MAG: DUF1684 domain-containing protein [Candidatus Puniceispirillales bacterium]